jgi:pimeloyl-ACP methyl ester carboxylesterase
MEDMSLRKIELQDTYLSVNISGQGQPLLLIHGFPLNHKMWHPQIEFLSSSAKVIAPDLRGHGQSPPTPSPYPMDLLADDCAAVLNSLGVDKPVIVCGLSMGGYVAFALYRRHPSLVRGMILAATRAGADSPEAQENREKAAASVEENGIQDVVDGMLPKLMSSQTYTDRPEMVNQVKSIMDQTSSQGMVAALMGMKTRPDSTPLLGEIKVPVLILHGADDQLIPLSESELMHSRIKGSQMEVIANAGHLPNLEQPEEFNQAVIRFLNLLDN